MDFTQAWLSFDPEDLRTQPEEGMNVEMEFDDGRAVEGMWGIDDLFDGANGSHGFYRQAVAVYDGAMTSVDV